MRALTIDCDLCGRRVSLEQGKEAFFRTGNNQYHVMDLCARCLDDQLRAAQSINDTAGFRQKTAALLHIPGDKVPERNQTPQGT